MPAVRFVPEGAQTSAAVLPSMPPLCEQPSLPPVAGLSIPPVTGPASLATEQPSTSSVAQRLCVPIAAEFSTQPGGLRQLSVLVALPLLQLSLPPRKPSVLPQELRVSQQLGVPVLSRQFCVRLTEPFQTPLRDRLEAQLELSVTEELGVVPATEPLCEPPLLVPRTA